MVGSLTRVRNNQVYNSDIYASAKLVAKSVTGGLLSDNFTYTGNMTIGNLTVNGNTTTLDTTNLVVADPLLAINRNQSGTPTYDLGFIMGRGNQTNVAMIWEETNKQFQLQFTTESTTSATYGVINNSGFANLQAYGILVNNATIGTSTVTAFVSGNVAITGGTLNNITIGATTPNTGVFTTANINGTLYASVVNAGTIGNTGAAFSGATSTLTSTSQAASFTTSGGGQFSGYFTGAIGANTANSGQFTTITATGGAAFNSNATLVTDQTTASVFNATATTINIGGAATTVGIGAATGTTTVANNLKAPSFTASGGGNIAGYLNGAIGANSANSGAFTTLSTSGQITAGGQMYITGNIIPSANVTYYLGNTTNRWKSLYLDSNTLYLGSFQLSDISGNLSVLNADASQYYGIRAAYITSTVIGNIAPAAGTFTNVTSVGQVVGYLTGAIGANSANSAAFTTLTTTGGAAFNSNATLTTDQATVTLFNLSSTTINLGGAATAINIGAATGTTTIANNLKAASFTASGGGNIAGYVNGTIGANAANSATFTTANVNGTLYAATVNAATIGNTGAAFSGATSTLTGASQAASFIATSGQISGYLTGALGANTPNSVVATSVTTSSGGQITGYLTGAIGANTANSGAFTTVTATGALTAQGTITSGGQVVGYLNGVIGANSANSGAFTTLTASGNITAQTANVYGANFVANTASYSPIYYYSNGVNVLSAITASAYSNANAAAYLTVYTGALTAANVTTVSGGQITGYLTGAIGANGANSGAFTTVTASGALTAQGTITGGGQVSGYLTGAIGANTANSAAFTTVIASGNITAQTANVYGANFVANTASYSPVYYYSNGVNIINAVTSSAYSNANAAAYLTIYTGNLLAGNITALNNITGYLNGVIGANAANSATFTTTSITSSTNTNGLGTGALVVTQGGASIQQDLYVGGNIYAANIISQTSQTLVVRDPLLYLSANSGSYSYEIGFYSNFTGGNVPQYAHTGLTRNHVDNQWYLFSNIPEPSGGTINLTYSGIVYDTLKLGAALIQNTTTASSTTSGALQVAGGAGIVGSLYAGSIQSTPIGSVTPSSGVFTGVTSTGQVTGYLTGAIGANTANSGVFTTITASGNITAQTANVYAANLIGNTAFYGGQFYWSNGATLASTITGTYSNSNVNSYLSSYTGTFSPSSLTTSNGGQVTAYLTGAIGANVANSGTFTTANVNGTLNSATINASSIGNSGTAFSGTSSTLSGASQAASFTTSGGGQLTGYLTGAIGANSANSGAFTTLTSSGALTSQGTITGAGQVIGYFNGAIGANTANSGAFTTITATNNITAQTANVYGASLVGNTAVYGAQYYWSNGTTLAATITGTYSNSNVASYLPTYTGTLSPSSLTTNSGGQVNAYLNGAIGANTANSGVFTTANVNGTLNSATINAATIGNTGAVFTGASQTLTGNVNALNFNGGNAATVGYIIANSGTSSISTNTGALQVQGGAGITGNIYLGSNVFAGTLSYSDVNIKYMGQLNINNYVQNILQNTNNGTAASADVIVNNDQSTATTYYGDFGMNSSGFSGSGSLNAPNNVYLTSTSSDLVLGTTTNNAIRFVINGAATDSLIIDTNGNVVVQDTTTSTSTTTGALVVQGGLGVVGNINAGSIQNTPIGNGTASTGVFTTLSATTLTTSGNITAQTANVYAAYTVANTGAVATNFFYSNGVSIASTISAIQYSNTQVGAYLTVYNGNIKAAYITAVQVGNSGTTLTGTLSTAAQTNITSVGTLTDLNVSGNINTSNSIITNSVTAGVFTQNISTYNGTGNLNVFIPSNANLTVNASQIVANLVVHGSSSSSYQNLLVTNGTTGQVGIKVAPGAITTGASLQVNATDSIMIPAGSTGQRPTGVTGMIRYNTNGNYLEYWNAGSSSWTNAQGAYTTVSENAFTGDGSTTAFTLDQTSTTNGTFVSVNGVLQIPTTAYSVSGTTLTFTEAPVSTDIIDARVVAATTTVSGISGTGSVTISANAAVYVTQSDIYLSPDGGNKLYVGSSTGTSYRVLIKSASSGAIEFKHTDGTTVGSITTTNSSTAYNTSSDYRLKQNVVSMTNGLSTINALNPVAYKWISTQETGQGFIAHELAQVIPSAVTGTKDAVDDSGNPVYQGVDYSKIVVHLVAALRELKTTVDAQAAQIVELQSKVGI